MRRLVWMAVWICSGIGWGSPAGAQSDENIFVGSRPLALGGAFTAVADDANAMFYNPAGIQSLRQHEITFMNADLFGTGIRTMYLAYALPVSRYQGMGIDWQHVGFGDGELGYNRDIIKVAFARRFHPRLSAGASFKYLLTDMSLDGQSVGKGSGIGFDAGVLFSPTSRLKLGVSVHDMTGTGVNYSEGGSATVLPRMIRVGAAWQATKNLLLAADVDRKVHLGGEYWYRNILALRIGTQKDLKTSDPLELTVGLGLHYRAFQIDLTHAPGKRGLGQTQRYGFTMTFDPASSAVRVVDIEGKDLFASYYKTYEGVPLGRILLQNKSDKSLECRLTVSVPGYEEVPYQETLIVRKGEKAQPVPLRLALSDRVLNVSKDVAMPVEVKVEYATATKTRSDKRSSKIVLYGRGALLWDDIGRAAAFVTSRDPEVEKFARNVSHQISMYARLRRYDRNIVQAAAVFEALRRYGVRYQIDPNNPYTQAVGSDWPFDNIQYPRQLLRQRTGDCDDCTVLYCAMLENLGIPTGVVDAPGHIFAVFDTGVESTQIYRLGIPEDKLLRYRGGLWVPVETTMWGKPFEETWEAGLRQLRDLPDWEDRIRPVTEAWLKYPPADPPFDFTIEDAPVREACDSTVVIAKVEALNGFKRAFVNAEYGSVLAANPDDPELHFEMAFVYMSLNLLHDARASIRKAAALSDDLARIETGLGNTCFLEGDMAAAVAHYRRAAEVDPDDPGLRQNLERAMKKLLEEERLRSQEK